MAKRLKAKDGAAGATVGETRKLSNGFDAEKLQGFADRIHQQLDAMESSNGAFKKEIKDIYDEAVEEGVPRKLLHMALGEQRSAMKREKKEKRLERDEADLLDQIKHALGMLGDLPLGKAAVERQALHADA